MRHLLFIALLISTGVCAQTRSPDTVRHLFNDEMLATTPDKAFFSGYAIQTGDKWSAVIFDRSNTVVARGSYHSKACKSKEGWFTFYYQDGKRAASGQFHRDRKQGTWIIWYPSGQVRDSLFYQKDLPEGSYYTFFENGKLSGQGKFLKGLEDSTWQWYHANGRIASVEEYQKGILKGQRCTDSVGQVQLTDCKLYAEPLSSEKKTIGQLIREYPLPSDGAGKKIEGFVTAEIHITDKGELAYFKILQADHQALDSAARNLLAKQLKWSPAYNHNRSIHYNRTIQLPFFIKPYFQDVDPRLFGNENLYRQVTGGNTSGLSRNQAGTIWGKTMFPVYYP